MAQSFKSNHNSVYACRYHVVWCPKYRRKVLTGEIAERLKVLVQELAAESESEVLEIRWAVRRFPWSNNTSRINSVRNHARRKMLKALR